MEIFSSISDIFGILSGGGLLVLLTWQFTKRKAAAEAKQAEAEAKASEVDMAQKVQDTYQQMLADKQGEVDDNHRLIEELRQDRDHYKKDRDELRGELEKLSKQFLQFKMDDEREKIEMKRDIARNGRMVECMRPFLCGRENCGIRVPVTISANGELERTVRPEEKRRKRPEPPRDIEPLEMKDM